MALGAERRRAPRRRRGVGHISVIPVPYVEFMLIDCDTCLMRETTTCRDCVVMVLFSDGPLELDSDEQAAIETLADAGLVPRLRLVTDESPIPETGPDEPGRDSATA